MAKRPAKKDDSMFSDTQKGLAWFISISFVLLIFLWVLRPPVMAPESMAQLNALVSTLVTLVVMAFGYFLGSSRSSKDKDDSNALIVEKLTSTQPPGTGPVAPVTSPLPVVPEPWWNRLKDEERAAITAAAPGDKKVEEIVAAPVTNKAPPDDLAYLVSKGLLTQERATIIQT